MGSLYIGENLLDSVAISYDTEDTPTNGSTKPLSSGGAFSALAAKADLVDGKVPEEQIPKFSYSKEEVLSNTTKTMYGLEETAFPDDVFAKCSNVLNDIYDAARGIFVRVITTSGNITLPNNLRDYPCTVLMCGGGGGGGGAKAILSSGSGDSAAYTQASGGGGGGGHIIMTRIKFLPSQILTCVIGAGGIGGTSYDEGVSDSVSSDGERGGDTTMSWGDGNLLIANGGGGGTQGIVLSRTSGSAGIGGSGGSGGGGGSFISRDSVTEGGAGGQGSVYGGAGGQGKMTSATNSTGGGIAANNVLSYTQYDEFYKFWPLLCDHEIPQDSTIDHNVNAADGAAGYGCNG